MQALHKQHKHTSSAGARHTRAARRRGDGVSAHAGAPRGHHAAQTVAPPVLLSQLATTSSSAPAAGAPRRTRAVARAGRERAGPSGLHVDGHSPTSPSGWEAMRTALSEAGVKVVSPQEMKFAAEEDKVVLIDVRPEADYEEGHLPGAFSVPFYRPITGWQPFKIARRVGYALFGVLNGTEVNPNFVQEVREVLQQAGASSSSSKTLVLYCSQGGVLESTEAYKRGWQTRSLVAAYDCVCEGITGVQVLKDGYRGWYNSGREVEVLEYSDAEPESDAEAVKAQ